MSRFLGFPSLSGAWDETDKGSNFKENPFGTLQLQSLLLHQFLLPTLF